MAHASWVRGPPAPGGWDQVALPDGAPFDDDEATEPKTSVIGRFGNALNCTASLYIRKSTSMINRYIIGKLQGH